MLRLALFRTTHRPGPFATASLVPGDHALDRSAPTERAKIGVAVLRYGMPIFNDGHAPESGYSRGIFSGTANDSTLRSALATAQSP